MRPKGARPPSCHMEDGRHAQHPRRDTDPRSPAKVAHDVAPVVDLAAYRELRAWIAACGWLNAHGYAAAVPDRLVQPLSARGLVVWGTGVGQGA